MTFGYIRNFLNVQSNYHEFEAFNKQAQREKCSISFCSSLLCVWHGRPGICLVRARRDGSAVQTTDCSCKGSELRFLNHFRQLTIT